MYSLLCLGRDRSVGLATRYGLDGPGTNPDGRDFLRRSRPCSGSGVDRRTDRRTDGLTDGLTDGRKDGKTDTLAVKVRAVLSIRGLHVLGLN